ncbi:MAG: cytochrome bc complex cytochrome b subunit [Marmoricola sp.]
MSDLSAAASTNGTSPAGAPKPNPAGAIANWADERLGIATATKKQLRKVFPDHWSFMLGEIALWSFVILLLTGVFLSLWFKPSMGEVVYNGSYDQLRGIKMSEAYESTLHISFDVRAGLLMRQMHHWAAMLFIAAMLVHMMRVFLTGAFRKPRELNWIIGGVLLLLGILEGFAGYSLPDDLLSGTGLRIADGLVKATPVLGSYMSFFMFGGEFPGDAIIPRLYIAHVLLIPGLLLALIGAHMLLLVYHKHTQWPGPGKTEENVVGYPMMPVYAAKAGGFFFIVFGVVSLMGGLMTINPVWRFGPYNPAEVTAGSQPDWYMGIAEGLLRIMPGWETHIWGITMSWNIFLPGQIAPIALLSLVLAYPFIEQWVTGDKTEHHLLQRPRNAPTRTAFLAMMVSVYGLLWAAGGNDILATTFHLDLNTITYFMRGAIFVIPPLVFIIAKRWCISLQRHDNEMLLHGYESGVIMRDALGGYSEKHVPLSEGHAYRLTARARDEVYAGMSETDANGVSAPKARMDKLRAKASHAWFATNVQKPTPEELAEAAHHNELEHAHDAPLEGHAADGHQFDGRHDVAGDDLTHKH